MKLKTEKGVIKMDVKEAVIAAMKEAGKPVRSSGSIWWQMCEG